MSFYSFIGYRPIIGMYRKHVKNVFNKLVWLISIVQYRTLPKTQKINCITKNNTAFFGSLGDCVRIVYHAVAISYSLEESYSDYLDRLYYVVMR
jgi:hypothetical protein